MIISASVTEEEHTELLAGVQRLYRAGDIAAGHLSAATMRSLESKRKEQESNFLSLLLFSSRSISACNP